MPIGRLLELSEVHLPPVNDPQRLRQRLCRSRRFGLLHREGAPLDGVSVVPLFLAEAPVPSKKLRLHAADSSPSVPARIRSPLVIHRSALA